MKKIIPVILFVLFSLIMASSFAGTPDSERKKRAEYYYLEALRQNVLGNEDAYVRLLQRAHELNPEDAGIGNALGYHSYSLAGKDSVWRNEAMDMIRKYVAEYPADVYSGVAFFSMLAQNGKIDEAGRVISRLDSLYPDKSEIGFKYAEFLGLTGDSLNRDSAIAVYNRIEKSVGKTLALTMPKLRIYLSRKDTANVLSEVSSLIAASPNSVENLTFAGDVNLTLMRNDSALAFYNRACEADPASGYAFYKRAAFYQNIGDTARYEREIVSAIDKDNLEPEVRLELLRTLVTDMLADSTRNEEIVGIFDNVIDRYPREADLRSLYSSYLITQKKYAESAEQMSYGLDIDHSKEQDWIRLSYLYGMANDIERQKKTVEDALRYFPNSLELRMLQVNNLLLAEKYDESLEKAKESLEMIDSRDDVQPGTISQFQGLAGDIFQRLGNLDSAYVYYDRALDNNPDNSIVLNNYAYFLACGKGDLDKAENMARRAVTLNPESDTFADTYAWVLFQKGNYEKALEEIDRTMALAEKNGEELSGEVLHHAGDIYFFNKKPAEALEFWKRALKLEPDNTLLKNKVRKEAYYYEEK